MNCIVFREGLFQEKPGQLYFACDLKAPGDHKYYTAGKLIAWSIIHNRPRFRGLNKVLYMLMYGQIPELTRFDCATFVDSKLDEKYAKSVAKS